MARVSGLRCVRCGGTFAPDPAVFTCPGCHRDVNSPGILEVVYEPGYLEPLPGLLKSWGSGSGAGHFHPLLPVDGPLPSLGEGGTPLTRAHGLEDRLESTAHVYIKNEAVNPTGSFKDRLAAVVVARARDSGADTLVLVSSGNMAASVAAYAAVARLRCVAIVPPGSSPPRLAQIAAYGAIPVMVRGMGRDRLELLERASSALSWYNATSPLNPYGPEGARIAAYEEFAQLGRVPDWLIIPTGFGCNMSGHYRGYGELVEAGLADRLPRLVAVQPQGSPSLVRAFEDDLDEAVPGPQDTIAGGISQTVTPGSRTCLHAIRHTCGLAIAVSDEEIIAAARALARSDGILAEPSGAAGAAGLARMVRSGRITPGDSVVVVVTGHGLKDPSIYSDETGAHVPTVDPDVDQLKDCVG